MSCVTCRSRKVRCDRQRPLCAACGKSNRECTYLERRTVVPTKRRRPKTLEERLALLEARLGIAIDMISSESSATANETEDTIQEIDSHGKSPVKTSDLSSDDSDDHLSSTTSQSRDCSSPMDEDFTSQEIICSRVKETLPPAEVQQELFQVYFDQIHNCIPIIHKQRFYTTLKLGPDLGPPLCLQYSMWCLSSSVTPKYTRLCEIFYQTARRYAEISEAKGIDEAFTVYHAQCWHLVATFEAQRMYIARSWMSAGKCVRLVQMMGLHRIDKHGSYIGIIPEAESFIELEERRRTFWAAYLSDRFASKCSGWPMAINEHEIYTNLPSSAYAFENGEEETSISLADALADEGAANLSSPFAAVILATTLLGHVSMHIYNSKKPNTSETPGHCEYWAKHRELDTSILNMFMHLPDQFRVPAGASDINVVFLNITLQTAATCLHQAAIKTALKYHKDNGFIFQSMNRCITTADAITMATRCINRNDLSRFNLWSGFCLFMAGVVYCYDLRFSRPPNMQSQPSLGFLQQVLEELGKFHSVAQYFKTLLQVEIGVLRGGRRHGAGGGGRKQPNFLRPKDTNSQPRSSKERATSMAECHLLKALGGLLQHDTDDILVVQEEDIDRFPHTNEHVLDTKLQRQRLNSWAHSLPGKEQNRGFHTAKVLPTQRSMTSSSPASSTQDNRLDGRYEAPVHELFDLRFDNNNGMPQNMTVRVATDMSLRNEAHGLISHLAQGNQSGAFGHEFWGV
ncbi:fungal-specific transcription factor domain-containing protein [Leptodontidium sp. 2 PMI_412]|nr:fungal-specific transcription factor domain-containing protein [Leptodontidium sp. 2 PMI_412]